jgi:PadR family transcriptional regulator, regulatory protein PadR
MKDKRGSKTDLLPGTLEMLILKTLSIDSMHGYGIAQHIQTVSADVLRVEEGSLYPALQRLLLKGWVTAEWKQSANNRRARFYELTPDGRSQLGVEEAGFEAIFDAIRKVLRTT